MTSTLWLSLEGAVNVRDVGGLPTRDGRRVRSGKLIRSDNLQDLTDGGRARARRAPACGTVVDLRTQVEVDSEGPGPLTAIRGSPFITCRCFPRLDATRT